MMPDIDEKDNGPPMLVLDEDATPEEQRAATSRWFAQVAAYREKLRKEGKLESSSNSAPPPSPKVSQ